MCSKSVTAIRPMLKVVPFFSIPAPQLDSSDVDLVPMLNTSTEKAPVSTDLFVIGR